MRVKLARDVSRLGQGRTDLIRPVGEELLDRLSGEGVEPDRRLFSRLSVVTADLGDRSTGEGLALVLLARAVEKAKILSAWDALRQDATRLTEEGGRVDLASWWDLLRSRGISAANPAAVAALDGRQPEDHVPPRPRPFVGREAVIEAVSDSLAGAGGPRPAVALHGLPGAGKTAVALEETRETAQNELEVLDRRRERLDELERDKETILEYYTRMAPEALESLNPEERQRFYTLLRLRVDTEINGDLRLSGAFVPAPEMCTKETTSR